MASVELKHIGKVYDDGTQAVDDFTLQVAGREFLILVGPSGCGKTTTLRMIAGLEEISVGELYIDGQLMNDVKPKDRDIAMVFQNYALYPHMNVHDNMAFGLKMHKTPKPEIEARVNEAAQILGLEPYLKRRPKELSGGQKQRVAMGRAIVRNPKVFLMDEPLSNLDAKLRGQMRVELSRLHQRLGATIVYVTHDQTEAMTLGTRIVVMNEGVIQQVDTPANLYRHPANMFVAGFIGAPQINFLDVSCVQRDGDVRLEAEGASCAVPEDMAALLRDRGYVGRDLVAGVRPEDVQVVAGANVAVDALQLSATLRLDEMLGSESLLYLDCSGHDVVAKVEGVAEYAVGSALGIALPACKLHLFDKETEQAIRP